MNYVQKYIKLTAAAEEELRDLMRKHKEIILFDIESEDADIYSEDLPIHAEVTKHGFYEEYTIVKLMSELGGEILLYGVSRGEGSDDVFSLSVMTAEEILYITDKVKEHLFYEQG